MSATATLARLRTRATEVSGHCRIAFVKGPAAAAAAPEWEWPPLSLSRGDKARHAERLERKTRSVLAKALAEVTNVRHHQVEIALSMKGNVHVTETEWIVEHEWVVFFTARLIKQLGETTMLLAVNSLFWSGSRGGGSTQREWREKIGLRTHKADAHELDKPLRERAEKKAPSSEEMKRTQCDDVWLVGDDAPVHFHLPLEDNTKTSSGAPGSGGTAVAAASLVPAVSMEDRRAYWAELDPDSGDAECPDLPDGRSGATLTSFLKDEHVESLFLFGGENNGKMILPDGLLWQLDVRNSKPRWSRVKQSGSKQPEPRSDHAAVWWHDEKDTANNPRGCIYVIGGRREDGKTVKTDAPCTLRIQVATDTFCANPSRHLTCPP